jgi:hypothetical protein
MEGVCLFSAEEAAAAGCTQAELAEKELKRVLEGLAKTLFGNYYYSRTSYVCPFWRE